MLLDEKPIDIKTNIEGSQTFRIKASAKAFKILSSKLYSDKPKAIVQELAANAADSHTSAKTTDKPFDVKLPNNLDSEFFIRDYGIGLSRERIETIYTTYFESDKTNSNELTGCLGLGSKTPFSYTDSFSVTSFFNGKQYNYLAYLNESECPAIKFCGESDTTEHNGLKIAFDVARNDHYVFGDAARKTLCHFKVKPNILGQQIHFTQEEIWLDTPEFTIIKGGENRLIMGNIGYPISVDSYAGWNKVLGTYRIHIHAPIGAVEVTASREDLEYDAKTNKTKDFLDSIKSKVNVAVKKHIENQIKDSANYFEACCFYAENRYWMPDNIDYQGKTLTTSFSTESLIKAGVEVGCFRRGYRSNARKQYNSGHIGINISKKIKDNIWIDDVDKGGKLRLRQYVEDNNVQNEDCYVFTNATAQQIADFLHLPVSIVKFTSTLPKVRRDTTGTGKVSKPVSLRYINKGNLYDGSYLSLHEIESTEIQDGDVYVKAEDKRVEHVGYRISQLVRSGVIDRAFVIPKSLIKKIDTDKLIHGEAFVKDFIDEHKTVKYIHEFQLLQKLEEFIPKKNSITNKYFLEMVEAAEDYQKNKTNYCGYSEIVENSATKPVFSLDKLGMFGMILKNNHSMYGVDVDDAISYLNNRG